MKQTTLPNAPTHKVARLVRTLWRAAGLTCRLASRSGTLAQLPSLLGKSSTLWRQKYIPGLNNRKLASLVHDHTLVTFVSSYPRSGNTWMRYLLSDILLQNQGVATTTEVAQPALIIPDYYNDLITPRAVATEATGYLIKTHDKISTLQMRIGGDPGVRECKYLYLFRNPEDVLVSLFHYSLWETYIRSRSGGNIDLFCLEYLPPWIEHLTSYLDALEAGVAVYLVSYEELLRQPATVLDNALRWLGIAHTPATVQRAESNMRFGKLQAMAARSSRGSSRLFRRGVQGSGASELKPETLSLIRAATKDLMDRARESLARQQLKDHPEPLPPSSSTFTSAPHNQRGETIPAAVTR